MPESKKKKRKISSPWNDLPRDIIFLLSDCLTDFTLFKMRTFWQPAEHAFIKHFTDLSVPFLPETKKLKTAILLDKQEERNQKYMKDIFGRVTTVKVGRISQKGFWNFFFLLHMLRETLVELTLIDNDLHWVHSIYDGDKFISLTSFTIRIKTKPHFTQIPPYFMASRQSSILHFSLIWDCYRPHWQTTYLSHMPNLKILSLKLASRGKRIRRKKLQERYIGGLCSFFREKILPLKRLKTFQLRGVYAQIVDQTFLKNVALAMPSLKIELFEDDIT